VQFEVGNAIGELLRTVQRSIRDDFTERIGELHRTYAEAAKRATEAVAHDTAERQRRATELVAMEERLARHQADLDAAIGVAP
jgi:ubiquinone biosynthesis protein UbiJ